MISNIRVFYDILAMTKDFWDFQNEKPVSIMVKPLDIEVENSYQSGWQKTEYVESLGAQTPTIGFWACLTYPSFKLI